jgi:hypothetical protein
MVEYLTDLALERLVKYELMAAHAHKRAASAESPEARELLYWSRDGVGDLSL